MNCVKNDKEDVHMNIAIILSGGQGTRLGGSIPKQYMEVEGKPIIAFSLRTFEEHRQVDAIVVVAAEEWKTFIKDLVDREQVKKFAGFADAGSSRQHSILNGLRKAYEIGAADSDKVIIHDAARPNVTDAIIEACIDGLTEADGVMPALPLKDTVYMSEDGRMIQSLLNRDFLYAGQAPESFALGKYYAIQKDMTEEDLGKVRGSSEVAFRNKLKVNIVPGDEHNYKITTMTDLNKFKSEMEDK